MADPKAIFEDSDEDSGNSSALETQPACLKCGQVQRMMKCCTRCRKAFYCGSGEDPEIAYQILRHQKLDSSKETEEDTKDNQPEKKPVHDLPGVEIVLRFNKQKQKFKICGCWTGETIFEKLSDFLSVLPKTMKVIHKGKQLTIETVRSVVSPGAVMQVVGEPMESAEGLEMKDIEVLMAQMSVERNVAVRALRQSGGDLIDAMMTIGNK
ncbi:hypothetical protein BaRGS_00010110 [Batillaria attramentaria]|uniref:Nascent polypeptide-associated complex subunit alpha-like UBA domain-containing protein n=1 Tax=Batillaria attramentaria TaxID=370345 RepID=A0ABD0LHR1_9CAEN